MRFPNVARLFSLSIVSNIAGNLSGERESTSTLKPSRNPVRQAQRSQLIGSEVELEFSAHRCAEAIKELAEVGTAKIVLHVAWIEMIGDVENNDANPRFLVEVRNSNFLQDS